ncbi:glycine cleavage system aminomethyltransferase GcvT [Deinococcus sp. SDU3-2]|uniref:Aminomethyltransferase n=1 Tax=Deinococcus terrestris TaxID=2651870 RepID=A0A7X1NW84_9DEIO|nr:glycine cleavage system aminomethyltransferase GcvT [Deinococcus terrestris]
MPQPSPPHVRAARTRGAALRYSLGVTPTPETPLKRTPLHAAHLRAGARMVPFGGWDMPVQYAGVKAEHEAVRTRAGMFDVSHMGEFRVTGPDAEAFLQRVTTNDVSKLKPGRAGYNWLPNESGGLVDDIYVYRVAPQEFLLVVNASNIEKDWAHLGAQAAGYDVTLADESANWGLIAVQGPDAEAMLQPHTDVDLSAKKKNAFFSGTLLEFPVMFARTGYTGEDGFEVFVKAGDAEALWDRLVAVGLTPAGLGARDTLRLEAGFPLYGHEFAEDLHPLASTYTWVVKDKDHVGRAGIQAAPSVKLIGLALDRVPVREGYPVLLNGEPVGHVTSGSTSPTLGHPIAMALVRADAAAGDAFEVEVRGKAHPARRVELPFYKR